MVTATLAVTRARDPATHPIKATRPRATHHKAMGPALATRPNKPATLHRVGGPTGLGLDQEAPRKVPQVTPSSTQA